MASGRPISNIHCLPDDVRSIVPPRRIRQLYTPDVLELETAEVMTGSGGRSTRTAPSRPRTRPLAPTGRYSVVTRDTDRLSHPSRPAQPAKNVRNLVVCVLLAALFIIVVLSARMFQQPAGSQLMSSDGGQVYSVQVGGNLAGTWQDKDPQPAKTPISTQTASNPYSVLGKPTITVNVINQVLEAYHSPAAGKGQVLYDLGVQYGIDPALALGFFMHESTFGTQGWATETFSLGNMRCIPNHSCEGGYAHFKSWEEGFKAWYELIRNLYVAEWGLVTIDQIIPTYAPSADNNNEAAYIASVKHAVDTWRGGQTVV
jgi:hypothetical protein